MQHRFYVTAREGGERCWGKGAGGRGGGVGGGELPINVDPESLSC